MGHRILLHCSGRAVPNLQCSKTRRGSRKYSDEWEALRFWRLYCQETRERALQGAHCSSRGVKARLPQEVHRNRAWGSGHKCQWRRLLLDLKRYFFTGSKVKHWDKLLRERPPDLKVFKIHLDMAQEATQ